MGAAPSLAGAVIRWIRPAVGHTIPAMVTRERIDEAITRRLTDRSRLPAPARLWETVLAALRRRVGTRRANEWTRCARLVSLSDDEAVVAFHDRGACEGAIGAIHDSVQEAIRGVTNRKTRVRFVADPHVLLRRPLPPMEAARRDGTRRMKRKPADQQADPAASKLALPGPSDQQAGPASADPAVHEAMRMVHAFLAERGRSPRTFFVWGPEGSGKTRFLDLCREALAAAGREVVSMGSDHFRSLSDTARREGRLEGLRARLKGTGALLLDDAHHWAGGTAGRVDLADLLGQPWLVVASESPLAELPALRRAISSRGGAVVEARLVGACPQAGPATTLEDVLEAVAAEYGLAAAEIVGGARRAYEARQVCLFVARRRTGLGLAAIARQVGGRTRTTAHRAAVLLERRLEEDTTLRRRVASIESALGNG